MSMSKRVLLLNNLLSSSKFLFVFDIIAVRVQYELHVDMHNIKSDPISNIINKLKKLHSNFVHNNSIAIRRNCALIEPSCYATKYAMSRRGKRSVSW